MDFDEVIIKRKSIRSFEKTQVDDRILKSLVKDATLAPSSQNKQPWRFYIVKSKTKRNNVAAILRNSLKLWKSEINKLPRPIKKEATYFFSNMGSCPHIIFIFTKKEYKKRDSFIMSVSAAAQNIILSATNKGLATCWVGSFRAFQDKVKKIVSAKKDEELVASILVGYQKKGFVPRARTKKKLNALVKFV